MTIDILGLLFIMWLASMLIAHRVLAYITPKLHLETQTQKKIKWLISSIVSILTGLFSLLYLLLSLNICGATSHL